MSNINKKNSIHPHQNLREDGYKIRANMQQLADQNQYAVNIDINALPVPNRRYFADHCFVKSIEDFLNIYFCSESLQSKSEMRTCLQVRIPTIEMKEVLENILTNYDEIEKNLNHEVFLIESPYENEPEQFVKLAANIAFIAENDKEACIDFYHVSAFSKELLKKNNNELGVEPIVRVDLTSHLLDKLIPTLIHFINNNGETK